MKASCISVNVKTQPGGVVISELVIAVSGQAALIDVLGSLYDSGLCLLSVEQLEAP